MDEEMTEKELSYEPIRLLMLELESKTAKWLRKYGWEERCNFPDSCGRWCKEIEGQIMMCRKSEAIKIERDFLCE